MGTKNMLVANFLLSCAGSIQLAKLNQASRNPQAAAAKTLRNIMRKPSPVTRLMGLIEKEVIPFHAKASILLKGYLLSPATRSFLS